MKNLYRFIAVVFLLIFVFNLTAQQQNRFWYFGNNIGIDFGQGLNSPMPIGGIGNVTNEGSGVISDNNGNFLFYTDGSTAINNENQVFGTNLGGNASSTQSSIAVPDPTNCENFYIFSVGAGEIESSWGLFYAKISSSDWSVIESGELNCPTCVEKITAIPHSNGMDYWILSVQPNSKILPVYLLDSNGITRTIESQSPLPFLSLDFDLAWGAIKGSHDGTKVAVAFGSPAVSVPRADLLSFDNTSGTVSDLLNSFDLPSAYGIEFSPNNEYIFVSGLGGNITPELKQYLTASPYTELNAQTLPSNQFYDAGGLQLGPDGIIYMARSNSNRLSAVTNPNSTSWGYDDNAIQFSGTNVRLSLPNLVGAPNECNPCDISNSLIPNPDFENLVDPNDLPDNIGQLFKTEDWIQATEGSSDLLNVNSLDQFPFDIDISSFPPNGSENFVGLHFNPPNFFNQNEPGYHEYVGACLNSVIEPNTSYTFEAYFGARGASSSTLSNQGFQGDIVFLGIPNCSSLPLSGDDCKEDEFDEIGRVTLSIEPDSWIQQKISITIQGPNQYEAIMFGPSCNPFPLEGTGERSYVLVDELLLIQGENPCPSDCFTIAADSPACNADGENPSDNTYTLDFTFTNNNDVTFDKLLLFDNDENFALDAGGTLIQLPSDLAPGQSVELSWGIDALRSLNEEMSTYCFEIVPYNHDGPCCKAEHCIELNNCCELLAPVKSVVNADTEDGCCYDFGYETCVEELFISADIEILTEGLTIESSEIGVEFSVVQVSDTQIRLTSADGNFLPAGTFDNALQLCVGGLNSLSPEEQEISITWLAESETFEPELCPLACIPPEDVCAELIDPLLFCDDEGVYHYQFRIKNVNDRMLDASIAVLGPEGNTVPTDFSQATFPDFPDHTPNGDPFLVYDATTDLIDITLPNAVLGSNYEFIISLHDYRNINAEDGDYWCCYTPVEFTIDVTETCISGLLSEEPLLYTVYPNPAKDFFSVAFHRPLESDAELLMTDINGVVQHREDLEQGTSQYSIGVGEMQLGLYLVSVQDDAGHVHYERFFKN